MTALLDILRLLRETNLQAPMVAGHVCIRDPQWDPKGLFAQVGLCEWMCPHCQSHIAAESKLCLNGCGLPGWQYRILNGGGMGMRTSPLGDLLNPGGGS